MSTELWVTPDELSSPDHPAAFRSAMAASWLLWALSGRKYGGARQITERYECPCRCYSRPYAFTSGYGGGYFPVLHEGGIYNISICGGCGQSHRLRLRGRPIRTVESVSVQGRTLSPGAYEIHDDAYLAAASGAGWSLCSTVTVTYTYGVTPPEAGRRSARLLAEQLLLANIDPDQCSLPDRVTSVSRQGVSFTILDPQTFLTEGRLGLYEVDAFLNAANPNKAQRPARVFSPDLPRGFRVRGPQAPVYVSQPNDLVITPGVEFTHLFLASDFTPTLDPTLSWSPSGQISTWNGASSFPLDPYFEDAEVSDPVGSLRLTLPAAVTQAASLRSGVFDLYAVVDVDANTVMHILTGRVITP